MSEKLTGLQLEIMRVLWDRGEGTVADVQEALRPGRELAYSTVATILSRLKQRGQVTHRAEGRTFVYRPAVSETRVGTTIVGELVERVFGSPAGLVSHLLESEHVGADELAEIKELIERREAEQRGQRKGNRRAGR